MTIANDDGSALPGGVLCRDPRLFASTLIMSLDKVEPIIFIACKDLRNTLLSCVFALRTLDRANF